MKKIFQGAAKTCMLIVVLSKLNSSALGLEAPLSLRCDVSMRKVFQSANMGSRKEQVTLLIEQVQMGSRKLIKIQSPDSSWPIAVYGDWDDSTRNHGWVVRRIDDLLDQTTETFLELNRYTGKLDHTVKGTTYQFSASGTCESTQKKF